MIQNTDLRESTLHNCILKNTDFYESLFRYTSLLYTNLATCKNLNTIKKEGFNSVDFVTLILTYRDSGDRLNSELEYLYESAFPPKVKERLSEILSQIEYYSCFISYGSPDEAFASQLCNDLRERGIISWLWKLDYTVGADTWKEITERRRAHEKMIILCSKPSLSRPAVKREIQEQVTENPESLIPISLDDEWRKDDFEIRTNTMNLKPFLEMKNFADFSINVDYTTSLNKLLNGLRIKT